jgi:hypothetical protein
MYSRLSFSCSLISYRSEKYRAKRMRSCHTYVADIHQCRHDTGEGMLHRASLLQAVMDGERIALDRDIFPDLLLLRRRADWGAICGVGHAVIGDPRLSYRERRREQDLSGTAMQPLSTEL